MAVSLPRLPAISRPVSPTIAMLALLAAAGCVAPSAPPPAPPPPAAPSVAPPAPAAVTDWKTAPVAPGDWRYGPVAGGSAAMFGQGQFTVVCTAATRSVTLSVPGSARVLTVATTTGSRALPAGAENNRAAARLAGSDGLLDWIAFSRGRFAVRGDAGGWTVLPPRPEFARVVEDCRPPR